MWSLLAIAFVCGCIWVLSGYHGKVWHPNKTLWIAVTNGRLVIYDILGPGAIDYHLDRRDFGTNTWYVEWRIFWSFQPSLAIICIPLWLVSAIALAAAAGIHCAHRNLSRIIVECTGCKYSLDGVPQNYPCPECGRFRSTADRGSG